MFNVYIFNKYLSEKNKLSLLKFSVQIIMSVYWLSGSLNIINGAQLGR